MRVLAVSHNYPRPSSPSRGLFTHRLHLGLRQRGISVEVLQAVDWSPPWPFTLLSSHWRASRSASVDTHEELDGIRIHHPAIVWPVPGRLFDVDPWQRQAEALVRFCERRAPFDYDCVLAHFLVPDGYYGLQLARAFDVPVVAMAYGDDVHRWPEESSEWRDRLREVVLRADALVACSRRLAEDGAAWVSQPTPWDVVYLGEDSTRFSPATDRVVHRRRALPAMSGLWPAERRILLMLAQPIRAKGYVELLDAWMEIATRAPQWHLVMGGGTWGAGDVDIDAEVARRGLHARATWLGVIAPELIPELMRASDAFVLPSHNEGLSLSMLEAMASGLAVVATDVGGHAEVLRDGTDGWLIPRRDTPALARALSEVVGSEAERARRGLAARRAAERVGTPEVNAGHLAEVLQRVVGQRASRITAAAG
jgi:teichuronic acid biosynthesis glycosyltransferase TuaC